MSESPYSPSESSSTHRSTPSRWSSRKYTPDYASSESPPSESCYSESAPKTRHVKKCRSYGYGESGES